MNKNLIRKVVSAILAATCAVASLVYYLQEGHGVMISLVSAAIIFACAFLALYFLVSCVFTAVEGLKNENAQKAQEKSAPDKTITETFDVAGTHYCIKNIMKLATRNPDWRKTGKALVAAGYAGKRVFRYTYINKPVKLIPEPQNPHDPNAVMVQIAGEKVGYISAEEAPHVNDVLKHRKIIYISGFIGGGDQKYIEEDGTFERRDAEPYVHVRIKYK